MIRGKYNMKKRAISALMALCMALSLLSGTALAVEEVKTEEQIQAKEQIVTEEDNRSKEVTTVNKNEAGQESDSGTSALEVIDTETSDAEISLDTETEDVPAAFSLERAGG